MKAKIIFKWFDFWIGLFWDKKHKSLYLFPIPTVGVKIDMPIKCNRCGNILKKYEPFWECTDCSANQKFNPVTREFFISTSEEETKQLKLLS